MANRTATLYLRITTADGRTSYCKPVYQSKGRLKPQHGMVNGEPKHHPEGVYYLRFGADDGKQQCVLVGKDSYIALDKLAEKQRWLRDRERRVVPSTSVGSKPEATMALFTSMTVTGYNRAQCRKVRISQTCGRRPILAIQRHNRSLESATSMELM